MKRAVSISLGSSRRNHTAETTLCGEPIRLERIGTDGDQQEMRRLFLALDAEVDAFGFGGADLGLEVNERYYPLYSVHQLIEGVKSPVVDGGGVRALVERRIAQRIEPMLPPIHPKRALFCVGVARYAMVRSFIDAGYEVMFGDLAFGLGVPLFIRRLSTLHILARIMLPIMGRIPFHWLYPTGESQNKIVPKYESAYQWASLICDDFLYIKRNLPARLPGKIIVTNTTTAEDVDLLRDRSVSYLITSTPRLAGRTFGTNVMEAALTAIAGKGRPLTEPELAALVGEDNLTPTVMAL
ncbi:MAG: hypothetical protein KF893_24680 [Caldilineaceae bacterium]|nr:hypothetical protein [Caldilineaceae bacterium]